MAITTGVHIGMRIDAAKSQFFDRFLVKSRMEKAEHKFLGRGGGHVRKIARRSIRKRKAISKPGQPPTNRTGLVREKIFYVRGGAGVIIGPALLNRPDPETLELLEHGGTRRTRHDYWYSETGGQGRDSKGHFTKRGGRRRLVPKGTLQRYRPRPFMGPALEKTKPKLAEFWRDAII